jgi:hypothetical protein
VIANDVLTFIDSTNAVFYYLCGSFANATTVTDGFILKTDVSGNPIAIKRYSIAAKNESFEALDQVKIPGASGSGLAAFGFGEYGSTGTAPVNSKAWLTKMSFDFSVPCTITPDSVKAFNFDFLEIITSPTLTAVTPTNTVITATTTNMLEQDLCWINLTISGGKNALSPKDGSLSVQVIPNPVSGAKAKIYIQTGSRSQAKFQISGSHGQKIMENPLSLQEGENFREIDLKGIPAGIYSVQLTTPEGHRKVEKFVIQ